MAKALDRDEGVMRRQGAQKHWDMSFLPPTTEVVGKAEESDTKLMASSVNRV